MEYAPIALFTYNRPDHTKKAIESLLRNKEAIETDLFIFSDGPKNEKSKVGVKANRQYIHQIESSIIKNQSTTHFKSITIIERDKNWGLANSLISGINELTEKYGRVIVVEDDLILSPYFLKFMNEALEKYKDDDRVASVSAFLNPVDCQVQEVFFLRYFSCWGWATWKRGWDLLINDSRELLRKLRWKKNDFNIGGTGPFYGILYCDKVGLNDSWAIRFYASLFLAGKLQLFPPKSLALQNGIDGSGTHSGCNNIYSEMLLSNEPIILNDVEVKENKQLYNAYSRFYGRGQNRNLKYYYGRLKSFIRRLIGIDHR